MPRICIRPLDVEIEADATATIMGTAVARGYYWPTTCGGEGRCTTCACEIIEGAGLLEPMGRAEQKSLVYERGEGVLRTAVRLACQARLRPGDGTVVVQKAGVRPPLAAEGGS
jgi:2Fe-2S ferredoxin